MIETKSILYHKKGDGFCFVYLPSNATVDTLSRAEIDVFFPDGANACGEKHDHCSLRLTGSAENIVPPAAPIKVYLEKKILAFMMNVLWWPLQV